MSAISPSGKPLIQSFLRHPGSDPTAARVALAGELRRRRVALGISMEEAAARIRCTVSKISRMETAKVPFKRQDVADLLDLYRAFDQGERSGLLAMADETKKRGWWHPYKDVLPSWFEPMIGLEQSASAIRAYEVQFVHGLLQTEDYARAVAWLGRGSSTPEEIERRVEVRLKRQEVITGSDAPRFWVVLDEAVLWRSPNGAEVMCGQLQHLLEMSLLSNVTIQVAPFHLGGLPTAGVPVTVLRFPVQEIPDTVYLEHLADANILDDPKKVEPYRAIMDQLCALADTPRASREHITRALARYRRA